MPKLVNSSIGLELNKDREGVEPLDQATDYLQHLGHLAREYDRKFRELEEFAHNAQPQDLATQLRLLGERTTDRFRAAQQALLAMLAAREDPAQEQQIEAFLALCSCFDEMRILFQVLQQHQPQAKEII
jgi:hypothetical protein